MENRTILWTRHAAREVRWWWRMESGIRLTCRPVATRAFTDTVARTVGNGQWSVANSFQTQPADRVEPGHRRRSPGPDAGSYGRRAPPRYHVCTWTCAAARNSPPCISEDYSPCYSTKALCLSLWIKRVAITDPSAPAVCRISSCNGAFA